MLSPRINWKPSSRDLRSFGAIFWTGFLLLGLIPHFRHHAQTAHVVWGVGTFVGLLALLIPPAAKPIYWFWMGFGFVMGNIMSRVILTLFFFVILTPLAIVFRLTSRDELRRQKPKNVDTYWEKHPEIERDNYERLF